MKIGIIGLLAKQQEALKQQFPDHDLHFLDKDHATSRRIREFCKTMDQVITARFVSHAQTNAMPKLKTTWIDGGVSKFAATLEKLPTKPRLLVPAIGDVADVQVESVRLVEPSRVTLSVMSDGRYDAGIFKAVEVGDTLRLIRPTEKEFAKWRTSVNVLRNYYRTNHAIHSKADFTPDYVDLEILPVPSIPVVEETHPSAPVTPVQAVGEADAVELDHDLQKREERDLWRRVFAARSNLLESPKRCADFANKSVALYRELFFTTE